MEELISVIVPIYNAEKYLKRCIESIISQTYKNMEIILINDGSKDNSKKICNEFLKKDCRIKLINKENEGVSAARNYGINAAIGKYISFVDADDWLEKNLLLEMYNKLKEKDIKFFLDLEVHEYRVNDKISLDKEFLVQDPDGYLLRFNN